MPRTPFLKFSCLIVLLAFWSASPAATAPGQLSRPQGLPWRDVSGTAGARAINDVKGDNWQWPDRSGAEVAARARAYSTVIETKGKSGLGGESSLFTFGEATFSGHNYCYDCWGSANASIHAFLLYEDKAPLLWEIQASIDGGGTSMEASSYQFPYTRYVFKRDATNIRPQEFFWIPDSSQYRGYSYSVNTGVQLGRYFVHGPDFAYAKATTSCSVYALNECFDLMFMPLLGRIKIQLCNHEGGVRVKRVKQDAADGYIAGCFYEPGGNEWGGNSETGIFRWLNGLRGTGDQLLKVDVYDYYAYRADKGSEWLTRISYPSQQALENDIDGVTGQLKLDPNNGGKVTWDGLPPSDPEALLNGLPPPPSQDSDANPAWRAVDYEMIPTKACGPRSFLINQSCTDATWSYALTVSKYVTTVISKGDLITVESPGIAGGRVEGKAAQTTYGAWEIKESSRGRIVFEATMAARVGELIDGFIVLGETGSVSGRAHYACRGNWIGQEGKVAGPAPPPGLPWLQLLLLD